MQIRHARPSDMCTAVGTISAVMKWCSSACFCAYHWHCSAVVAFRKVFVMLPATNCCCTTLVLIPLLIELRCISLLSAMTPSVTA
eukprot:3353-Heterococcus_DN1.PRE.11